MYRYTLWVLSVSQPSYRSSLTFLELLFSKVPPTPGKAYTTVPEKASEVRLSNEGGDSLANSAKHFQQPTMVNEKPLQFWQSFRERQSYWSYNWRSRPH